MKVESLFAKVHTHGLELFELLQSSSEGLPDELSSASFEHRIQKIKHIGYENPSSIVSKAISDQVEGTKPSSDIRSEIADLLSLRSNQELLIEAVALKNMKENAEQAEKIADLEYIEEMIALITHMHDCFVEMKHAQSCNLVLIPLDFICPLSLKLMMDPVIVASGQTYEQAYIRNWIDLGLRVCPKTMQTLIHKNFFPNYTVKVLISNWCESKKVKLPDLVKPRSTWIVSSPGKSLILSSGMHQEETSPVHHVRSSSEVETQVKKMVEDLSSTSLETVKKTTAELRLLSRQNMDNRAVIANCGAIPLLITLLHSADQKVQENAVTVLLNLSLHDINKTTIANSDAFEPLIHILKNGSSEAKENSAATLFSLSVIEDNKVKIGRSGAIEPLVDLLGNGTPRGKKDAATALFNLSTLHENKARIVQAGAVKYLVGLMNPVAGMVDKAVVVLSNLATIFEGRDAIGQEGGIPMLVEVLELGSARVKENAAAALLQLCVNRNRFCNMVLQEGAVPPLVALSQSGTPRAKEKAQSLLGFLRNQRPGYGGRG